MISTFFRLNIIICVITFVIVRNVLKSTTENRSSIEYGTINLSNATTIFIEKNSGHQSVRVQIRFDCSFMSHSSTTIPCVHTRMLVGRGRMQLLRFSDSIGLPMPCMWRWWWRARPRRALRRFRSRAFCWACERRNRAARRTRTRPQACTCTSWRTRSQLASCAPYSPRGSLPTPHTVLKSFKIL